MFLGFSAHSVVDIVKAGASRSSGVRYNYTYNIHSDNLNGRSLQSISKESATIFKGLPDFEIFNDYYGQPDYADKWSMASADGGSTSFKSG